MFEDWVGEKMMPKPKMALLRAGPARSGTTQFLSVLGPRPGCLGHGPELMLLLVGAVGRSRRRERSPIVALVKERLDDPHRGVRGIWSPIRLQGGTNGIAATTSVGTGRASHGGLTGTEGGRFLYMLEVVGKTFLRAGTVLLWRFRGCSP